MDDLAGDEERLFQQLVARRAAREPVALITGHKEFWSLDFRITSDVLCPRADSETVIEATLEQAEKRFSDPCWDGRILDLGTGSGCLLLTLLSELTSAYGFGVDRSRRALSVARSNGLRLGLANRISWFCGDWAAALNERFDVIVSNPPYIAKVDILKLAPEIQAFEPNMALTGGDDGLDAYRSIGNDLLRILAPGGFACFEVGQGQADAVEILLANSGCRPIGRYRDLAGIDRCIVVEPS